MAKSNRAFEHKSVWEGLAIGGALAIVIGVLWFIFAVAGTLMESIQKEWIIALVIIVMGVLFVIIGDTVMMKKELEEK